MNQNELQRYIVDLRREFHQHPELSGEEQWTSERICKELHTLGIPYEVVGNRNVIGKIENGPGKRIAFRADFDALPVEEKTAIPWKSTNPGCMHACGHDAHVACLLGASRLFLEQKDIWYGTIYLCFQHGEETGLGADECIDYLDRQGGVDAVFSAHMYSIVPSGKIILKPGAIAAGCILFTINIKGVSGHGARPDLAVSAADIMCDIYQHITRIPSNRHEAAHTSVISPCILKAGDRFNVIPGTAMIEGSIRFFSADDGKILMRKLKETAEGVARVHGGSAEVIFNDVALYPVINDQEMAALGRDAAKSAGFELLDSETITISDNFGDFLHEYPGYYCYVGSRSERPGTSGTHHAPDFDLDEGILHNIADLFSETALRMLG